ncbi:hypothetical protein MTO96_039058 [Rhipicephalus appendiculatus]
MEKLRRHRGALRGSTTRLLSEASEIFVQDTLRSSADLQERIDGLRDKDTAPAEQNKQIADALDGEEFDAEIVGALDYHERIVKVISRLRSAINADRDSRSAINAPPSSSSQLHVVDLVVVRDDNVAALRWKLGRVVEPFPGRDGLERYFKIAFPNGQQVRRAAQWLYPLEASDHAVAPGTYQNRKNAVYVDAATYMNGKDAVVTMIDAQLKEKVSASLKNCTVSDAEEAAVALAVAEGNRSGQSLVIITDSQDACRGFPWLSVGCKP